MDNQVLDEIDAHCHLTRIKEIPHLGEWILGGYDPEDWAKQRELKDRLGDRVHTAFGLHPWWIAERTEKEIETALDLWDEKAKDAEFLGEMGLDSLRANLKNQTTAFQHQLEKAREWKKPVVLHIVKAHAEAMKLLTPMRGIVHGFSASQEIGEGYLKLGLLLSVGPQITRDGYRDLKKAIPLFPRTGIVIETDAPDQCPNLGDLRKVAEAVGRLQGRTAQEVLSQSKTNLESLICRG